MKKKKKNGTGPKNHHSNMIFYDVPRDLTSEKLRESIRIQNTEIPLDKFPRDFRVFYKMKSCHNELVHYIHSRVG